MNIHEAANHHRNLLESWQGNTNAIILMVRFYSPNVRLGASTDETMIEWSALGYRRKVPFTHLPCCPAESTGCLCPRPLKHLRVPSQFFWRYTLIRGNSLRAVDGLHNHFDIRTVAHELSRQSRLCDVHKAVAEACAPIPAHDSTHA
jgi:hypothetical protein